MYFRGEYSEVDLSLSAFHLQSWGGFVNVFYQIYYTIVCVCAVYLECVYKSFRGRFTGLG